MNLSKYNIDLPLKNGKGEHLIIQGYTGAVDVVSKDVYEILNEGKKDSAKLSELSEKNFNTLKARGYITDKDKSGEMELMFKVAKVLHKVQSKEESVVIAPSYNCNFRCPYCFEHNLLKHGNEWMSKIMDKDTVDDIFKYIDKLIMDGKKISSVTLFGGEPLLMQNYNIVKYIVNKCNERKLKIKAISNGYDLDHFQDLLSQDMISEIQITIDGIGENHNKRRFLKGGKETFNKIVDNICLALDKNINITVRTNVDTSNLDKMEEIKKFFEDKNWTKRSNFHNYFKCVHQCYVKSEKKVNDVEIMREISKKVDDIHRFELDSMYTTWMRAFGQMFKTKGYSPVRGGYCGGTLGMFVVDSFRDVYACWEVIGEKDKVIGTLGQNGKVVYNDKSNAWRNRTVDRIEECKECKYALFCAGGCPAHAEVVNGNMNTAYCEDFKEIFNEVVPEVYKSYLEKNKEVS